MSENLYLPQIPIQTSVLNKFGEMNRGNTLCVRKIGDSPGFLSLDARLLRAGMTKQEHVGRTR